MNTEIQLDAASGYLYLGMATECLEELEQVEFLCRRSELYMTLRLSALIAKREWSDALVASRMLKARHPECEMAYIGGTICLIEMSRYEEAVAMILSGPVSLRCKSLTHLQIAYCHTQLGNQYAAELALDAARKFNPAIIAEPTDLIADSEAEEMSFSN